MGNKSICKLLSLFEMNSSSSRIDLKIYYPYLSRLEYYLQITKPIKIYMSKVNVIMQTKIVL